MDIVSFFASCEFAVVLVASGMSRLVGFVACAVALLFPGWAGLRSATGPQFHHSLKDPPTTAQVVVPVFVPFVSSHARTHTRPRNAPPPTGPRQVLLTFDDGPDLSTTPMVLDQLDRFGMKAVFFVAGRRLIGNSPGAIARRNLLRRIFKSGHLVANHTVHHDDLCKDTTQIDFEIDRTQLLITQTLGFAPKLFRAPFGSTCTALEQALGRRSMRGVGWTIDPQDWRPQNPEKVSSYVNAKLSVMGDKAVVLLHDTHLTGPRALPAILAFIDDERNRAKRGEARPMEVVSPSVLLPPDELPTATLEPVAIDLGRNLAMLPDLLGISDSDAP